LVKDEGKQSRKHAKVERKELSLVARENSERLEIGGIWATERIRNCLDLRLIGEKAGDFVRKVEKSLSSTPGL
jgi:hypothetical protein